MFQSNPVLEMNTFPLPFNLMNRPRQPLSQFRLRTAPGQPQLLPLNRHPNWRDFILDLNLTILQQAPQLKESFLELLKRADQLE